MSTITKPRPGSVRKGEAAEPDERSSASSAYVMALHHELAGGMKRLGTFEVGDYAIEVAQGADSIWALVRRAGRGGLAIRCTHAPGGFQRARKGRAAAGEALRIEAESAIGSHRLSFEGTGADLHRLRIRAWLTPERPLLVPFSPRDLYPLDVDDDPLGAEGHVQAAQRGPNSGLVYLAVDKPAFGQILYFQNLTALDGYFQATRTKPMGAVGGEWPELGYLPPTPPQSGTPPVNPLPAGEEIALSDVIVILRDLGAEDRAGEGSAVHPDARRRLRGDRPARGALPRLDRPRGEDAQGSREGTRGDLPRIRPSLRPPVHRRRISRQHGADVADRLDPRLCRVDRASQLHWRTSSPRE